jgi:hypothetical protein
MEADGTLPPKLKQWKALQTILRILIAPFVAIPVAALVIIGLINFHLLVTIVGKLIVVLVVICVPIAPIKLLFSHRR